MMFWRLSCLLWNTDSALAPFLCNNFPGANLRENTANPTHTPSQGEFVPIHYWSASSVTLTSGEAATLDAPRGLTLHEELGQDTNHVREDPDLPPGLLARAITVIAQPR